MGTPSLVAIVMLLVGGITSGAVAAPMYGHSGTVVAITDRGIVLEEVGPWKVAKGRTHVERLTIAVPTWTPITGVVRDDAAPSGDFVEVQAAFDDIRVGDFVTVECLHEDTRLVARQVTILELEPAR